MNYKSIKPYPIPRVEEKNKNYAKLLLKNYAGPRGEETAIHLYLFQYLISNKSLKEFATAIKEIAEVEMNHLRLLGEAINLLGELPVYGSPSNNNKYIPWSSTNVIYKTNLKEILELNIKSEEEAIKNYQYALFIIDDKYIKELIERIIEDELVHLDVFNYFLTKYFNSKIS